MNGLKIADYGGFHTIELIDAIEKYDVKKVPAKHWPTGASRTVAGAAGRSQYAGTKSALVGTLRSWAVELAPRGHKVNVVSPAATDTPMLQDPARGGVAPRLPPIGRFVRPDGVAALAAFQLSQEAAITGQQLVICGRRRCRAHLRTQEAGRASLRDRRPMEYRTLRQAAPR